MLLNAGKMFLAFLFLVAAGPATAAPVDRAALTKSLQTIVNTYLATRGKAEGFTGISASVSLPGGGQAPIDVVAGRVSRAPDAAAVTPGSLFQIGSITKSMTSTVILQLVQAGVLSLDAPIGPWLPEYPAWGAVTLRHLLDMTSGIPSYDSTDAFFNTVAKYGIHRHFTPPVLLSFTDPDLPGAPKPTTGYDYANVNYIIAQMVVERATGRSLDEEIRDRLLTAHGLNATYYSSGPYPAAVISQEVSSYMTASPTPILNNLVGQDLKYQDPSWAQGAGAAVATPEDITRWVRLLFQGGVLAPAQRHELTQLVSMKTGQPMEEAVPADKSGFGLGVAQTIAGNVRFWFYEGEPMGSRMFYGYFPDKDLVIVIAVNSAGGPDKISQALIDMYAAVTGEKIIVAHK